MQSKAVRIRIKERKIEAEHFRVYRAAALRVQHFRCFYCREPLSSAAVTGDHARPRARRGKTTADNIKATCLRCNKFKGDMDWGDFLVLIKQPLAKLDGIARQIAMDRHFWTLTWVSCERIAAQVGIDAAPVLLDMFSPEGEAA
tara:strand:+ start:3932 stop:4363 length:432 start_codon:yes stop_codon:yes gene_type:complete